jgi:hypothetical protein
VVLSRWNPHLRSRQAVEVWIAKPQLKTVDFLFHEPVQRSSHIGTRQYAHIVDGWGEEIGLDDLRHALHVQD